MQQATNNYHWHGEAGRGSENCMRWPYHHVFTQPQRKKPMELRSGDHGGQPTSPFPYVGSTGNAGRWNTMEQTQHQAFNRPNQHYPVRDSRDMGSESIMVSSPYQPSEITDNIYERWEESYGDFITLMPKVQEDCDWSNSGSSLYTSSYPIESTALNKDLAFSIPQLGGVTNDWKHKSVKQWESNDIMFWILSVASENDLNSEDISISQFRDLDGATLCNMSEADFIDRERKIGKTLFNALQQMKQEQQRGMFGKLPPFSTVKHEELDSNSTLLTDLSFTIPMRNTESHHSSDESEDGTNVPPPNRPEKRRPGRPRMPGRRGKKPEKKTGRLWEFIRDLLLNRDYCPSLICWENHEEGVFRFVRSEKVAQLWGTIKENPKMTYEKLSRAMRYYYKSKVLQPVLGRRLVYKFGPSATGWRTPNPNFRL
ncbi:ETS homologous factor-like isoform X3 [Periplaneta americana]|uniref:ETS homologous factor-like isoform X3 n=1 Tax=Periplaneta americana TaxID=6978 RepID=UPI0037E73A01